MKDSTVIVLDGSRGSGKTLSAAWECAIRMVAYNETVISNVPISFDFIDEDKPPVRYTSKPLNIDSLLALADDVRNATIFWDEMSLWAYSRSSGAVLNKLITLVLTLIRKRKLSLIITTQSHRMLDKNVMFQCDGLISCFDLSYKYPRDLKRGEVIAQNCRDLSGLFTGVRYEESQQIYERLFKGTYAWGIYDTNFEFDVLAAQGTKYQLAMNKKVITGHDVDSAYVPVDNQTDIVNLLRALPDGRYAPASIEEYLSMSGIDSNPAVLGRSIKKAGLVRRRGTSGYFYEKCENDTNKT